MTTENSMTNSMSTGSQWFDITGGTGRVTNPYGIQKSYYSRGAHTGVDWALKSGSSAYALGGGTVTSAGFDPTVGNYIEIQTAPGQSYRYAHLNEIGVKKGDVIKSGQEVGLVGNTGSSSRGAHLHSEFISNGDFVSPEVWFGGSKNVPKFAQSSYVQGSKGNLGRAFTYKGQDPIKGGTDPEIPNKSELPSLKQSKQPSISSIPSNLSANVVNKIY